MRGMSYGSNHSGSCRMPPDTWAIHGPRCHLPWTDQESSHGRAMSRRYSSGSCPRNHDPEQRQPSPTRYRPSDTPGVMCVESSW